MSNQLRMQSVDAIRTHQRAWLAETRSRAEAGEPFVICTSDEAEESLNALGIPVLVINYWSYVVIAGGGKRHFSNLLNERGYPGDHFFGLGYATSLDPDAAPWGGLPRPQMVIGSTRHDYELRVCELWAAHFGVPCIPLDFNFNGVLNKPLRHDWWEHSRSAWRELVDPHQLALRVGENSDLVSDLESMLGTRLEPGALAESMTLLNEHMDVMMDANGMIADAPFCPVSLRDQNAAYQTIWHRGTTVGLELAKQYRSEVSQRIEDGIRAYDDEKYRVLFWSSATEPKFHQYMRDAHRAAFVSSNYASMPAAYARDFETDPAEALAARQLFLFDFRSTSWMMDAAARSRVDAVIGLGDPGVPSAHATACEAEGIPYLTVADGSDSPANRKAVALLVSRLERSREDS